MRRIDKIILHCSATPEGRNVTVEDIRAWHIERGFRTIGYHYVIYLDGSVHAGRPVEEIGAHCLGQNQHSIGVCYIGGLDARHLLPKDTRTEAQKIALRDLTAKLLKEYPGSSLHGHKEFAAKACPCFEISEL
ncbi:MAG: N-acetylmuramoyl-L-alanine amidase [Bacteroides sp.]|nr:N-acetylmuramoyl-L-alanine amidase [Bacteroides sp.]